MAQCPLPAPGTRYSGGPDTRGTLDILYTCVSVIVLSSWNVLHLNVPLRSYPQNWKQRFRRNIITATTKTFWMFLTVFSPEILIARSLEQRLCARKTSHEIKDFVKEDQVDWSTSHSFFADMRGFEIVFSEGETMPDEMPKATDRAYADPLRIKSLLRRNASRSIALIGAGAAQIGLSCRWPSNLEPALGGPQRPTKSVTVRHIYQPNHDQQSQPTKNITVFSNQIQDIEMNAGAASDSEEDSKEAKRTMAANGIPLAPEVALSGVNLCRLAITHSFFSRAAHWLGPIAWCPDVNNWRAVVQALDKLHLHHDLTPRQFDTLRRNILALQGSSWRPNGEQLLLARSRGIIPKLPHLPADDLEDRSQSDEVLKLLSTCQILWLVAQVIARAAGKLPITLLEIIALALATCALTMYALLWSKPQDVRTTVRIQASRYPTVEEITNIALAGITFPAEAGHLGSPILTTITDNGIFGTSRPMFTYHYGFGLFMGGIVFGSFHLIPWNFRFPTETERLLWRAAALVMVGTPIIMFPVYILVEKAILRARQKSSGMFRNIFDFGKSAQFVLVSLYVIARVYSLVECIRSLFFLEPEAFRTSFLNFLPHFG